VGDPQRAACRPDGVRLARCVDPDAQFCFVSDPGEVVESTNTKVRLLTRMAFGFKSPDAMIALAMLNLGGYCPPLPGRRAVG